MHTYTHVMWRQHRHTISTRHLNHHQQHCYCYYLFVSEVKIFVSSSCLVLLVFYFWTWAVWELMCDRVIVWNMPLLQESQPKRGQYIAYYKCIVVIPMAQVYSLAFSINIVCNLLDWLVSIKLKRKRSVELITINMYIC